MIIRSIIVASLLIPAGGDLLPGRGPRAYVKVQGIDAPFHLSPRTLNRYDLESGETISPALARKILREYGVNYPADLESRLNQMERDE